MAEGVWPAMGVHGRDPVAWGTAMARGAVVGSAVLVVGDRPQWQLWGPWC